MTFSSFEPDDQTCLPGKHKILKIPERCFILINSTEDGVNNDASNCADDDNDDDIHIGHETFEIIMNECK